jgi:hypothetical protein
MGERKTGGWMTGGTQYKACLHRVIDVHTIVIIRPYNGFVTIRVLDRCISVSLPSVLLSLGKQHARSDEYRIQGQPEFLIMREY